MGMGDYSPEKAPLCHWPYFRPFGGRPIDDFGKGGVGEFPFRGYAFTLGAGRQTGQLVAEFLLVGFGKNLTKIGKLKSFGHGSVQETRVFSLDTLCQWDRDCESMSRTGLGQPARASLFI
jgi:hypothetical protein